MVELLNVKIFLYSYIPDFFFFNEAEGTGAIYFSVVGGGRGDFNAVNTLICPPLPEIRNKNPTTESTVSCVSL